MSTDGLQQFSVFGPWAAGGRSPALRVITFEKAVPEDILVAQLVEKYGQPIDGDPSAGFRVPDGWTRRGEPLRNVKNPTTQQVFRAGSCQTSIGVHGGHFMEVAQQTSEVPGRLASSVALIKVQAGRKESDIRGRYDYDPAVWASCGPPVLASIRPLGEGTELTYALFDLAERSESYNEPTAPQVEELALPKL